MSRRVARRPPRPRLLGLRWPASWMSIFQRRLDLAGQPLDLAALVVLPPVNSRALARSRRPAIEAVDLVLTDPLLGHHRGQASSRPAAVAARRPGPRPRLEQFGEQDSGPCMYTARAAFVQLEPGRSLRLTSGCLLASPEGRQARPSDGRGVVGGVQLLGDALDLGALGRRAWPGGAGLGGQGGVGEGRAASARPAAATVWARRPITTRERKGDGPGPAELWRTSRRRRGSGKLYRARLRDATLMASVSWST